MLDVRTPIVWNKPKSKIYNYNQEITGCYYKVIHQKILLISLTPQNKLFLRPHLTNGTGPTYKCNIFLESNRVKGLSKKDISF